MRFTDVARLRRSASTIDRTCPRRTLLSREGADFGDGILSTFEPISLGRVTGKHSRVGPLTRVFAVWPRSTWLIGIVLAAVAMPITVVRAQSRPSAERPPLFVARAGTTSAVRAAAAAVNRRMFPDDTGLDNKPGAAARLTALWRMARRWTKVRLDHGDTLRQIAAKEKRDFGHSGFGISALRLDRSSVIFSAGMGDLGTVFILRRASGGRYMTAMNIDDPTTWGARSAGQFAAWQPQYAPEHAQMANQGKGLPPLWAQQLLGLPDEANGARRFAIVAHYAQAAGATQGFQVSVWRWNGRTAKPLVAVNLAQMADESLIVHLGRHRLVLHAKTSFKSFWSCGDCPGRQVRIPLELTPHGARLGTERSLVPELDLADEFDDRAYRCRPVGSLVAPGALPRLRGTLYQMCKAAPLTGPSSSGSLGMLDDWKLNRHGSRETLCLTTEFLAHAQLFSIIKRAGRLLIVGLRRGPKSDCSPHSAP